MKRKRKLKTTNLTARRETSEEIQKKMINIKPRRRKGPDLKVEVRAKRNPEVKKMMPSIIDMKKRGPGQGVKKGIMRMLKKKKSLTLKVKMRKGVEVKRNPNSQNPKVMNMITIKVRTEIDVHSLGVENGISRKVNTVTIAEQGNEAEVGTGAEECDLEATTVIEAEAESIIDTESRSTGEEEGHEAEKEGQHQEDQGVKIGEREGEIPGVQREKKVKAGTKKDIKAKKVGVHTEEKILRVRKERTRKIVTIIARVITGRKRLIETKVQSPK